MGGRGWECFTKSHLSGNVSMVTSYFDEDRYLSLNISLQFWKPKHHSLGLVHESWKMKLTRLFLFSRTSEILKVNGTNPDKWLKKKKISSNSFRLFCWLDKEENWGFVKWKSVCVLFYQGVASRCEICSGCAKVRLNSMKLIKPMRQKTRGERSLAQHGNHFNALCSVAKITDHFKQVPCLQG